MHFTFVKALGLSDLERKHGIPSEFLRGVKARFVEEYITSKNHPPNAWVDSMITKVMAQVEAGLTIFLTAAPVTVDDAEELIERLRPTVNSFAGHVGIAEADE